MLMRGLLIAAAIVIALLAWRYAARHGMPILFLLLATVIAATIILSAAYIFRWAFPIKSRRGVWLRRVCLVVGFLLLLACMAYRFLDFDIYRGYPGHSVEFRLTSLEMEYINDQSNETMHAVLYHNAPGYTRIYFDSAYARLAAIIVLPWALMIVIERINRRFPRWSALPWEERGPPPGFCEKCGYNLTGNVSGICPECGEPVPEEEKA